MTNPRISRLWIALASMLLALGIATRAQAQTAGPVALLDDAYATLSHADHDYKGHRVKAMEHVKRALGRAGGKVSGHGRVHEPQAISDAQLRNAAILLEQARTGLSRKSLRQVNAAIKEISVALRIR